MIVILLRMTVRHICVAALAICAAACATMPSRATGDRSEQSTPSAELAESLGLEFVHGVAVYSPKDGTVNGYMTLIIWSRSDAPKAISPLNADAYQVEEIAGMLHENVVMSDGHDSAALASKVTEVGKAPVVVDVRWSSARFGRNWHVRSSGLKGDGVLILKVRYADFASKIASNVIECPIQLNAKRGD